MTLESDRYIVFVIESYAVALPISKVLRVIRSQVKNVSSTHTAHTENFHSMGLIQVGKRMIRVLNLEQLFTPFASIDTEPNLEESIAISSSQISHPNFFVITKDWKNELCGIPTTSPPNLINLPQELVQPLPPSDQETNSPQVVSHFVTLTDTEAPSTIFLLNF